MMKNNKKKIIKWIIIISVLVIISAMLILALGSAQGFDTAIVRSDTTNVLIIFLILLPISLLLLLVVYLTDRKKGEPDAPACRAFSPAYCWCLCRWRAALWNPVLSAAQKARWSAP